jgi:hypothetical protein
MWGDKNMLRRFWHRLLALPKDIVQALFEETLIVQDVSILAVSDTREDELRHAIEPSTVYELEYGTGDVVRKIVSLEPPVKYVSAPIIFSDGTNLRTIYRREKSNPTYYHTLDFSQTHNLAVDLFSELNAEYIALHENAGGAGVDGTGKYIPAELFETTIQDTFKGAPFEYYLGEPENNNVMVADGQQITPPAPPIEQQWQTLIIYYSMVEASSDLEFTFTFDTIEETTTMVAPINYWGEVGNYYSTSAFQLPYVYSGGAVEYGPFHINALVIQLPQHAPLNSIIMPTNNRFVVYGMTVSMAEIQHPIGWEMNQLDLETSQLSEELPLQGPLQYDIYRYPSAAFWDPVSSKYYIATENNRFYSLSVGNESVEITDAASTYTGFCRRAVGEETLTFVSDRNSNGLVPIDLDTGLTIRPEDSFTFVTSDESTILGIETLAQHPTLPIGLMVARNPGPGEEDDIYKIYFIDFDTLIVTPATLATNNQNPREIRSLAILDIAEETRYFAMSDQMTGDFRASSIFELEQSEGTLTPIYLARPAQDTTRTTETVLARLPGTNYVYAFGLEYSSATDYPYVSPIYGDDEYGDPPSGKFVIDRIDLQDHQVLRLELTGDVVGEITNPPYISDGGDDMYDDANFLSTNLSGDDIFIPYTHTRQQTSVFDGITDTEIVDGTAHFGEGSEYFTMLYPAMFVLAARNIDITSFSIEGNLGADGGGQVAGSVEDFSYGGSDYTLIFKKVFDAGDPSINHLIIVPGTSAGITQVISEDTNDDQHDVGGLSGRAQLYYLVLSSAGGLELETSDAIAAAQDFMAYANTGASETLQDLHNALFAGHSDITDNVPSPYTFSDEGDDPSYGYRFPRSNPIGVGYNSQNGLFYLLTNDDNLFTFNPETNVVTYINEFFPGDGMTGLTVPQNNVVYSLNVDYDGFVPLDLNTGDVLFGVDKAGVIPITVNIDEDTDYSPRFTFVYDGITHLVFSHDASIPNGYQRYVAPSRFNSQETVVDVENRFLTDEIFTYMTGVPLVPGFFDSLGQNSLYAIADESTRYIHVFKNYDPMTPITKENLEVDGNEDYDDQNPLDGWTSVEILRVEDFEDHYRVYLNAEISYNTYRMRFIGFNESDWFIVPLD